jgi:hypothetical protein
MVEDQRAVREWRAERAPLGEHDSIHVRHRRRDGNAKARAL